MAEIQMCGNHIFEARILSKEKQFDYITRQFFQSMSRIFDIVLTFKGSWLGVNIGQSYQGYNHMVKDCYCVAYGAKLVLEVTWAFLSLVFLSSDHRCLAKVLKERFRIGTSRFLLYLAKLWEDIFPKSSTQGTFVVASDVFCSWQVVMWKNSSRLLSLRFWFFVSPCSDGRWMNILYVLQV